MLDILFHQSVSLKVGLRFLRTSGSWSWHSSIKSIRRIDSLMTIQGNELVLLAIVILIIGIVLMLNEGGGGGQQAAEPPAPPEPQEPQGDADPFSVRTSGPLRRQVLQLLQLPQPPSGEADPLSGPAITEKSLQCRNDFSRLEPSWPSVIA